MTKHKAVLRKIEAQSKARALGRWVTLDSALQSLMELEHQLETVGEVKLLKQVQALRSEMLSRKLNLEKAQRMQKK